MNTILDVIIDIPQSMQDYADAAVVRVGYARTTWVISRHDRAIVVRAPADAGASEIRREVLYAVYREKILSETMDMRRALLETVTRR